MKRSLVLAALLALPAAAQDRKGDAVLEKVAGAVSIIPAGSKTAYKAKGGESLLFGDTVRTAPGAVAQLTVGENAGVLLHENAKMVISGGPRRPIMDVARGEFLIGLKKKLLKSEWFKVRTPAAVAAVRGTLFWGKVDADKSLTLAGFGHRVEVTALGKTVAVDAGQTVTVKLGQPPGEVRPHDIPVSYFERFHVDGQLQGLEKLVDLPAPAPKPE